MKISLATLGLLLCLAVPANADLITSWEGGGLDGWFSPEPTASLAVGTTGATDGTNAVAVTHGNVGPGEVALLRIDNGDPTWWNALKNADNTKMLVDVFVPSSSINPGSWSKVGFRLQGGGITTVSQDIDFAKVGGVFPDQQVTLELDLTSVAASLPSAGWGQVTVTINGGGGNSLSPVYVDNYRIVTTAVPEPSSIAFMTIGSVLFGLGRRRTR